VLGWSPGENDEQGAVLRSELERGLEGVLEKKVEFLELDMGHNFFEVVLDLLKGLGADGMNY
jgi:hypothetical protein